MHSNALHYYLYVGRWSRMVADIFIDWLDIPTGSKWLDVGTGTGIVVEAIFAQTNPTKVIGVDKWEPFIVAAQDTFKKDSRAEFYVGDATRLHLSDGHFDVATAGLVLNFIASPQSIISNMAGRVKPGGVVAAYVWAYADKMEMLCYFWQAASSVDPSAAERNPAKLFTICYPDKLTELFEGAGLKDVAVIPIDIQTLFTSFYRYWRPFVGAHGSVSKYLGGLNQEMVAAIRDQLQRQIPIEADGTIRLMARAWAIKGKV
jgi:SAM-dependent methyltransferase